MNAYKIKMNYYYRIGYTITKDGDTYHAYRIYTESERWRDKVLEHLANAKRDYPKYTFWLEESQDDATWTKLSPNRMYELFSPDEPEEEKKPAKKVKECRPEDSWVWITPIISTDYHSTTDDDNVPF